MESTPTGRRRAFVLMACMAVMFMTAVEGNIIATAMPTIATELGGYELFGWTFAAYLLTQATSIPIYGRLADLYGRKPVFFAGASLFIIGSAICGAAPTMFVLIIGRAVQGLGAGGIVPIAQTIVGDIYTPAERARIQGYLASMWGISAVVGPVIGAFIVQKLTWPLIFWFNIPLALGVIAMLAFLLKENHRRQNHAIDVLGAILLIVAVGGLMLALLQYSHLGALLIPTMIGSAAAFVLLALHESRTPEPLLPVMLWRDPVIRTCNLGNLVIGASAMGVSVFMPTYVQGIMGGDAFSAGAVLAAMSIGWPLAATFSGRLMLWTSYRTAAVTGGCILIVGSLVLATLEPARGTIWATAAAFIIGAGMGLLNSPFMVAAQDVAAWNLRGIATASNAFNRMLGAGLGTAILGAMVNLRLGQTLPGMADPLETLIDPAKRASLAAVDLERLVAGVGDALHVAFWAAVVMAMFALAVATTMPPGMKPGAGRGRRETPDA